MWFRRRGEQAEELALVRAAIQGDAAAFQKLVYAYSGLVYTIAFSRLKERETAEDMVQEVFLRVYLNLGKLQNPSAFGGWLVRLTRNLALDWISHRRTASRLVSMVPLDEILPCEEKFVDPDVREVIDHQRLEAAIREAIFSLPEDQREVVLLYFSENMTLREIGTKLGVHRTTVRRYVDDALARLHTVLEPSVRESMKPMRFRNHSARRTAAMIAVAGVMSAGARSALAKAAAETVSVATVSTLAPPATPGLILQSILQGGFAFMKAKALTVAAVTGVALVGGTGYHYLHSTHQVAPNTMKTSEAGSVSSSEVPTGSVSLEGSWIAIVKDKKEERAILTFVRDSNGKYLCNLTSSEFGVEGIPADEVTWDGKTLRTRHDRFKNLFTSTAVTPNEIRGRLKGLPNLDTAKLGGKGRIQEFDIELTFRRIDPSPAVTSAQAVVLSPQLLDSYTGTYAANPTTQIKFARDGNTLLAQGVDGVSQRLYAVGVNEFGIENDMTRIVFQKGAGGQVDRLIVRKVMGDKTYDRPLRKLL